MAIPYLLGLAAGSVAVISWKYSKEKKIALSETEAAQESETDSGAEKASSASTSKKEKA